MKGVDKGVKAVVEDAAGGDFNNTPFIGTLKNGGVGLAPFHNYESKVDPSLAGELKDIKAKIISGDIEVTSAATPK
jgi:basic membrane protein A